VDLRLFAALSVAISERGYHSMRKNFRVRCYDAALEGAVYLTVAILVPVVLLARLRRGGPDHAEL